MRRGDGGGNLVPRSGGGGGGRAGHPCGVCRQMLAEFGDMPVFCAAAEGDDIRQTTLSALLPDAFTRGAL